MMATSTSTCNVGRTDRAVRTALGAVTGLLALAVLADVVGLPAVAAPVLGVASLGALVSAATGVCGVYALFGVSTR